MYKYYVIEKIINQNGYVQMSKKCKENKINGRLFRQQPLGLFSSAASEKNANFKLLANLQLLSESLLWITIKQENLTK